LSTTIRDVALLNAFTNCVSGVFRPTVSMQLSHRRAHRIAKAFRIFLRRGEQIPLVDDADHLPSSSHR